MLIIALIVSPINRIQKNNPNDNGESALIMALKQHAEFVFLGDMAAANQGPYQVTGFRHVTCEGSIALLPLYRNAEGIHILKQLLPDTDLNYGILFNRTIYQRFPQFLFALEKFKKGAYQVLGKHYPNTHKAMAFAEVGECNLADLVIKQTL